MHRSMLYSLSSVTAALCLLAVTWHVYAAEPAQSPRRHSLIQRQAPEGKSADAVASTEVPRTAVTPSPRSLHRKLTKRPAQLSTAGPSTDTYTSQSTAPSSQATSAIQPSKAGTDSRVTTTTGSTGIGASTVATAPITTSSLTSTSSARVPMAGVVAGASVGAPTSRASTSVGRGLQRLTAEMPSLTQLVSPTVSVSSPTSTEPSSAPPATSSGTGGATLSWTLNSETDLAGYKVYVGTASGLYSYPGSPIVIGRTDNYAISGLPVGQTYYFAISAFDNSGNESALSSEVSKSIY